MLVIYADSYLCVRKVALSLNEFSRTCFHKFYPYFLYDKFVRSRDRKHPQKKFRCYMCVPIFKSTYILKKCFAKVLIPPALCSIYCFMYPSQQPLMSMCCSLSSGPIFFVYEYKPCCDIEIEFCRPFAYRMLNCSQKYFCEK